MNAKTLTQEIKGKARELGFVLAGVTRPDPPEHMHLYRHWLEAGRHAQMDYLAAPRAVERRSDPRKILPECQSILVLAVPYNNPEQSPRPEDGKAHARVAAYACGQDYHEVLKPRLQAIVAFIEQRLGHTVPNRWYTDSGPLLERELAQRAGLGWIGKNSLLINPQRGSYFLLAEILLGVALEVDAPFASDHCGSCRRCLQACPTDCILPDRTLDASRCISYLTIELKDAIPQELRPQIGDWAFGCDICQEVCPWNQRFAPSAGDPAFEGPAWMDIEAGLGMAAADFNSRFKDSPVKRARRRGLLRNLAVAAGNLEEESQVGKLSSLLLSEKEPLGRGHAAWALGRIAGAEARAALEQARVAETDSYVLGEIERALKEMGD